MESNDLPKLKGVGNLDKASKKTYFKAVKQGLARRYPLHPLLRLGADSRWWIDILYRFSCDSHRSALNDFSQSNAVKSVSLYRDTTSDLFIDDNNPMNSSDALYRAKNLGKLLPMNSAAIFTKCQILFIISQIFFII